MGLCYWFNQSDIFILVAPSDEEMDALSMQGLPAVYWGREKFSERGFTDLRQNLVLLMCAMNNEL